MMRSTKKPNIQQSTYGVMPNGEVVTQYHLQNRHGVEVSIITYGGIITSIKTPDKHGKLGNIVLGLDDLTQYMNCKAYFGSVIGRYAGRISQGKFNINDEVYILDKNNNNHHLHGGVTGFDRRNWQASHYIKEMKEPAKNSVGVKLQLLSGDGDQGYPGNLNVTVDYILTDDNQLMTCYQATTDKTTHVNLTQHSYFNLACEGDILSHQATIYADEIAELDHELIPTGKLMPVDKTAFDFRVAKTIGNDINNDNSQIQIAKGYDHSYVLNKTKPNSFDLAASVYEPESGRKLNVYTDEPSVQFYTGNSLTAAGEKQQHYPYTKWSGFCLEPQHFPDTPNKPHFPSTLLYPGEVFSSNMCYQFEIL